MCEFLYFVIAVICPVAAGCHGNGPTCLRDVSRETYLLTVRMYTKHRRIDGSMFLDRDSHTASEMTYIVSGGR